MSEMKIEVWLIYIKYQKIKTNLFCLFYIEYVPLAYICESVRIKSETFKNFYWGG